MKKYSLLLSRHDHFALLAMMTDIDQDNEIFELSYKLADSRMADDYYGYSTIITQEEKDLIKPVVEKLRNHKYTDEEDEKINFMPLVQKNGNWTMV